MSQEEKYSDYLSYKKNKMAQRVEKKSSKKAIIWVFILTFAVCFALVMNFASRYGKKMDIEYGRALDNQGASMDSPYKSSNESLNDFVDDNKNQIDTRLRLLQLEETAPNEAKIIEKKQEADVIDKQHLEELLKKEKETKTEPITLAEPQQASEPAPKPTFSKVLIGRYDSFEKAKAAQAQLREEKELETLIRKMGDVYSLQVGSYLNEEKAQAAADSFSGLYPVWILQD